MVIENVANPPPTLPTSLAAYSSDSMYRKFSATAHSGFPPALPPRLSYQFSSALAASRSAATGFSLSTCFPASSACRITAGCARMGSAMKTAWMSARARRAARSLACVVAGLS